MPIAVRQLNFVYNPKTPYEKHALIDVNLEVNDGEFLCIVGHTGSGKSTFVQHLNALVPVQSGFVEVNVVDKTVRPAMGIDSTNLSVKDYFAQNPGRETEFCTLTYNGMGIYESTSEQMADEAVTYAKENNAELIDAVVEVLCRRISYVGGFILAFVMILILLTVIGNIPNISFQIPNHELLNDIGGAVTGFLQGLAFCLIIGWALRFVGLLVSQETLSNTFLVSWFMDRTIFVHLLGI